MTHRTSRLAALLAGTAIATLLAASSCGNDPTSAQLTSATSLARAKAHRGPHRPTPSATPVPTATPTATPTAAAPPTPTPTPTKAPSPSPASGGGGGPVPVAYFQTLAPGSPLPSDSQCAAKVGSSSTEARPANSTANHTNVFQQGFRLHNSYLAQYGSGYESRVTGNYGGTTDQILKWGACKWGFDVDSVRAQAVIESNWNQSQLGDCNGKPTQPETHGCESVGILQVRGAGIPAVHPGTWPAAYTSTAFNVDYTLAVRRLCFDGNESYLHQLNASYAAGDLWGCIGRWFSGGWHDPAAETYISKVKSVDAAKPWTSW